MLNKVVISGRLVDDPEYRVTGTGTSVAMFRVAVERDYKNKETGERGVDFFQVSAWRGLADFVVNYILKGTKIEVEGRLEQSTWKDGDGNVRHSVAIVAERIYFAGDKRQPKGMDNTPETAAPQLDEPLPDFSEDGHGEGSEL